MLKSRDEKLDDIKNCIQNDVLASDLKISLFVAAAKSYKRNFFLNPFPSFYIEAENSELKNFDKLVSVNVSSIFATRSDKLSF